MTDPRLQSKIKFKPRDYQEPILDAIIEWCKKSAEPAFVDISVGGGKTAIYAFIANHVVEKRAGTGKDAKILILARQGELVKQNSDFSWKAGFNNSVYSASLKRKNTHYPIVYGTEGTVARQIGEGQAFGYDTQPDGSLKFRWVPDLLMIDECLTGKTLIRTNQGYIRIDDPKLKHAKIYCINESTGEELLDKPARVFSNGTRNISRVKFKGGKLECTSTHRLYSKSSWVRVKNLRVGQMITLDGSRDFALKKLLRAAVAVTKRLFRMARG